MKKGRVFLVGAGPGDAGLITLNGVGALVRADVVVYDHLVNPRLLGHAPSEAKLIYAGKESGRHTYSQEALNRLLVREAQAGRTVVRLKGGDPFVFGRGGEELYALRRAGVDVSVVPGVTSAIGAASSLGLPLTDRALSSTVGIATAHETPEKARSQIQWKALAESCQTLVFLMGVKTLPRVTAKLMEAGLKRSTPAAVIEKGTSPSARCVRATLGTIAAAARRRRVVPPAILIVGRVVGAFRPTMPRRQPLSGRRIVVTRSREQASELVKLLEARGAEVWELPVIKLVPPRSHKPLDRAISRLDRYAWILFTSANGVRGFRERLLAKRLDARALAGRRIACIGEGTARSLRDLLGIRADRVPKTFTQEGLSEILERERLDGKQILIVRAESARDVLPKRLRSAGARVEIVSAYRTVPETASRMKLAALSKEKGIDWVTLTSSSCAAYFSNLVSSRNNGRQSWMKKARIASIGPVTTQTARKMGLRVALEARRHDLPGLVQALSKGTRR